MATFNNGESGLSVRNKLNTIINKVEGVTSIDNDITFGDDNKAIFGAGSDLQIYHDGSNSYVQETGTGQLLLRGAAQVKIESSANDDIMVRANSGGSVDLFHAGSEKLATTSTGVDITGTLTSDGLTVNTDTLNGEATFYDTNTATIYFQNSATGTTATDGLSIAMSNEIAYINNREAGDLRIYTNNSESMRISSNGDISFYDSAGSSQSFFWDAADERLGIGMTSPTNVIETDVSDATVYDSSANLRSSSSLRILNSSETTGSYSVLKLDSKNVNGTVGQWRIASISTSTNYDNELAFATRTGSSSYAERMRIDSSGNLLVGKTSAGIANIGFEAQQNGNISATREGTSVQPTLRLNKLTDDGIILRFDKDGSEVGSIGSRSSAIYIGRGDTGISFTDNDDAVYPVSPSGLVTRDAAIDLGISTTRFKDLYLSGGVYLGGTTSDNLLDDYEEGTWNATDGSGAGLTLTLVNNTYTKVGRLVTCAANVVWPTNSSTSLARVTLPFTSVTTNSQQGGVVLEQDHDSTITLTAAINYTDGVIFRPRGYGNLTNANLSGKRLRFILTYHAA